jgi:hypothetical protein
MAAPPRQLVVVADSNVPLDLAGGRDLVVDAVLEIRRRLRGGKLLIPPTVVDELAYLSRFAEEPDTRENAHRFLQHYRQWGCELVNVLSFDDRTISKAAAALREREVLPATEVNDSFIVVESAAMRASLLLTTDEHVRGIDFQQLKFVLEKFGLVPPAIATPREIIRNFLR